MPGVFVNYRREDAFGFAGALVRDLERQLDQTAVFMDVADAPGGADSSRAVEDTIASCDVMLSLIGERWLHALDRDGRRRLDQPDDSVRSEIVCAMRHRVRLIPILLGEAEMPKREQLPSALETLADLHAMHLSDRNWEGDAALLLDQVRNVLFSCTADPVVPTTFDAEEPSLRPLWLLGAVICACGLLPLVLAVVIGVSTVRFVARAWPAQGEVVALVEGSGRRHVLRPVIAFRTAEGQSIRFTSTGGSGFGAHAVGDKVGVLYHPGLPKDARERSAFAWWTWPVLLTLMGVVFEAIGGVTLAVWITRRAQWKHRRQLALKGRPVMTAFHAAVVDPDVSVNGEHPFRVVTEWTNPVTGEGVLFRSEHVWKDPSAILRHRSIVVVIDPDHVDQHLVDLSLLPQDFRRPPRR